MEAVISRKTLGIVLNEIDKNYLPTADEFGLCRNKNENFYAIGNSVYDYIIDENKT